MTGTVGARAETYPSKPITIYCAQPPGSGPDTMARLYAEVMGRNMGQRILVVNQPGAAGTLAASTVSKAAPDGYTVLLVLGAVHTVVPAMQNLPFDPINDFKLISLLYISSGVLVVPPSSPAKNFAELASLLKSKGANATYGSPSLGSPGHVQAALLAEKLGVPAKNVSYRGGAQMMTDLIGGLLDYAFLSTVQAIAPINQHQARGIAIGTTTRMKALPDVPTLAELGYGDVVVDSWFGVAAPKGTPPEIIARLNAELRAASSDSAIVKRAEADQVAIVTGTSEEADKFLADDFVRMGNAVKRLGIKSE
jgi:tripartite-type tricarboxylate transporter receptor subunit TctC